MLVSQNRGPQYRILHCRDPTKRVPTILGNLHMSRLQIQHHPASVSANVAHEISFRHTTTRSGSFLDVSTAHGYMYIYIYVEVV